ncbi:helix-turn-helix domain-containing protein [Symbiobacterium terraclitae]|uniref:helix-turn-helix domain-containing protein n=1 Tax=Symbiobacterium terraclitae TaxID=557451 RepID=UPI0035B50394
MPKVDYVPAAPMALTIEQTALELQVSENNAYALVRSREVPSLRITEGTIRVPRALLELYLIARALEETYGDGAGGYNIPPLLGRLVAGIIGDDIGAEEMAAAPRRRGPVGARRRNTA